MRRILLVIALLLSLVPAMQSQVAVIANRSVPLATIDAKTLDHLYTLTQKSWTDGSPVRLYVLKSGSASAGFIYDLLGTDALQLRKLWLRAQLTGEGRAPTVVTEGEMVNVVADTPGAIGYVSVSKVTDRVKVLLQIDR